MALLAPAYYTRFACTADACRHTCCRDWEIDVDPTHVALYASGTEPYFDAVRQSLTKDEAGTHIRLCLDGRCPHLDERGLCRIILSLGEEALSTVCREHPRFFLSTASGGEVGLGLSCEAACHLILSSDDYDVLVPVGQGALYAPTDATAIRSEIYRLLKDTTRPYPERLSVIEEAYNVSLEYRTSEQWRELLASLEYLKEEHARRIGAFRLTKRKPTPLDPLLERALAYFLLRHLTEADSLIECRAAITLALLLEQLLASLAEGEGVTSAEELGELARMISEELEYSEENTERLLEDLSFSLL